MAQLENKVALITGAKGGLGSFVTEAFLAAGAMVAGVSRSIRQSDFAHPSFVAMPAELSSSAGAKALADTVIAKLGRLDAAVHLVGGFAGGKPVAETDDAMLDKMLEVNLRSAFYLASGVIPHMRKQGGGRFLAIGSRIATDPVAKLGAYGASKAALVSLVRTLALENKDRGITANVVLPSTMDTPSNRKAMPGADFTRWVDPRQVAALLVHLASDAASSVNGAVIPILGGEL